MYQIICCVIGRWLVVMMMILRCSRKYHNRFRVPLQEKERKMFLFDLIPAKEQTKQNKKNTLRRFVIIKNGLAETNLKKTKLLSSVIKNNKWFDRRFFFDRTKNWERP